MSTSSSSSLDSCSKDSGGGGDETTMTMNGAVESSAPSQDSCHLQTMALAPPTLVKNTTRDETPPLKNISRVVEPHDGFITCPDDKTGRAVQKNVKKDSSQGDKLDEILAADDQNMGDCDEFNDPNPRTFTRPQYKTNEDELCNSLNHTRIRAPQPPFSKASGDDDKPTKTNNNSKVELEAVMTGTGPSPQEVNKDLGAQKDSSDSSETSETSNENVDEYETCDTDESDDFYDAHDDSEKVNPRGRASIIRNLEAFNAWLAQLSRSVAIRLWHRSGIPALISGRRGQRVIEGTRKLVKLAVIAVVVKYYVGFLNAHFGDPLMNISSETLQQIIHDCLADVVSDVFYFIFGNRVGRQ